MKACDTARALKQQLRNMNPVVLSLFAALHTNDLLDLKARQDWPMGRYATISDVHGKKW